MSKVIDLDAFRPKPVRVRYGGKEYEVRRDLPASKASDLLGILHQLNNADKLSWDEQLALVARLPKEAAALMTEDEQEREALAASMPPEIAAMVCGLALGRHIDETTRKAAGKKRAKA